MNIYFPVAEINVNVLFIIFIGMLAGFLANVFGIGGGFIATPLLMVAGVPPHVATACATHQIVGSSFIGVLSKLKHMSLDIKLASLLAVFGIIGSYIGVMIVKAMNSIGQVSVLISMAYAIVMSTTALSILTKNIFFKKSAEIKITTRTMPWNIFFPASQKSLSIVTVGGLGIFVGFLTGIMGIGGGFITVPIMTYALKLNKRIIIGTSLTQIFIITLFVTGMNVFTTNSLDLLLGIFLISGGIVGSFLGASISRKIKFEHVNFLLALLILMVSVFFIMELTQKPRKTEMFTLEVAHQPK